MGNIKKLIKDNGQRFTSQKKEVLSVLQKKPQTVLEIYAAVHSKKNNMDKVTVYRILTLLKEFKNVGMQEFLTHSELDTDTQSQLKRYMDLRFEIMLIEEGIPQWVAHNVALGNSDVYQTKYFKNVTVIDENISVRQRRLETLMHVREAIQQYFAIAFT